MLIQQQAVPSTREMVRKPQISITFRRKNPISQFQYSELIKFIQRKNIFPLKGNKETEIVPRCRWSSRRDQKSEFHPQGSHLNKNRKLLLRTIDQHRGLAIQHISRQCLLLFPVQHFQATAESRLDTTLTWNLLFTSFIFFTTIFV